MFVVIYISQQSLKIYYNNKQMINDTIKQSIEQYEVYNPLNESMSEGLTDFIKTYIKLNTELLMAGTLVLENEYEHGVKLLPVLRSLPITLAAFKRLDMTEEEIIEDLEERINQILNETN